LDVAPGAVRSPAVSFAQVKAGELMSGWDAVHRVATQKDGIVGSIVGQNSPRCHRNPDIAMTPVKASPTESSLSQEGNFRDFWARRVHVPSKAQLPKVLAGPGVTSPKSRPPGCRAGHAGHESFPLVLPGPLLVGVDEELAIDGVGDVSLERADRLPLGLALGHLPLK